MNATATIDRSDAEEFIRLHAEAGLLEKKMKPLKDKLLAQLILGAVSPVDLPFILVDKPQTRKTRDWESFVMKLLRGVLGSAKRAKAEWDRIESRWPASEIHALHVEKNPTYAATVGTEAAAAR